MQFTIEEVAKIAKKDKQAGQLIFLDSTGNTQVKKGKLKESIHAEIKRELVERGMDPTQVAIINGRVISNVDTGKEVSSGNKDERKQAIVDAYNAGAIKVVIGTTTSMGEGMNLQVPTTDIWHMDIPYTPGAIRQRNGRGVRYKNRNDKVNIHMMFMRGSFDSSSFELVSMKKGWNEAIWDKEVADVISTEEDFSEGAMPPAKKMRIEMEPDPIKKKILELEFENETMYEDRGNNTSLLWSLRSRIRKAEYQIDLNEDTLKSRLENVRKAKPNTKIKNLEKREEAFESTKKNAAHLLEVSKRYITEGKEKLSKLEKQLSEAEAETIALNKKIETFNNNYVSEDGEIVINKANSVSDANTEDNARHRDIAFEYRDIDLGDKVKARRFVNKMTGRNDQVNFVRKLFSSKGEEILGRYHDAYIDIAENKGNVENTARHEALHYAYDLLLTEREAEMFDNAAKHQNLTHEEAIEGVNQFARNKEGMFGTLKVIGLRLLRRIRQLFGQERAIDWINEVYDRVLSGIYAKRGLTGYSNYDNEIKYMSVDQRTHLSKLIEKFKNELSDVKLNKEQQSVYDVVTGNKHTAQIRKNDLDHLAGFVRLEKGSEKSGATHIIVNHFSGDRGQVTAREIIDMGEAIRHGKITQDQNKHIYTLWKNKIRYRVIVVTQGKKQNIITFYSNKITRSSGDHSAPDGTKTNNERAYTDNISDNSSNVKYRTAESIASDIKNGKSKAIHAMDFAKRLVANRLKKDINAKKDVSKFDLLCGSISYYSSKVPALSKVFDAAMGLNDDKHRLENWIFNANHGDGESELQAFVALRRTKRDEYDKLETDYLWHRDINNIGYTVKGHEKGYRVFTPDGVFIEEFTNEAVAWDFAWKSEAKDMKDSGQWSDEACDAVYKLRKIMGRQYEMLVDNVREQQKECESVGMELPQIDGVDIFDELRKMGDRRGHYMPRLRHGDYLLWAKKKGENPRLETFDTKTGRAIRMTVLEKKGYSVEISQSNKPSEEAFAGANILAMNDLINNALDRIKHDEKLTYEQFGLTGKWVDFPVKDGKERHFVIDGDTKKHRNLFKEFGGNFYNNQWHFKDRKNDFPKKMLNTVAHIEGTRIVQIEALSQALTEQLAAIIHSHGSRARKIGRDGRVGKEVYLGFEKDSLRAVTMAGRSAAAGSAKRIMAKKMLEAFTGTDLKWNDYKEAHMPDDVQNGTPEFYQALSRVRTAYEQAVEDRRVDSSKQKNAYKEGREFIQEMIRNQEPSERVFGFIKGIAAFKYLSGISSGIVNLTALATSVPAAMKAFGNIPFHKQAKLLVSASNDYIRYMMRQKFGKGGRLAVSKEWLFNEITKRGWDSDLRNQEAVGVMQTWSGQVWRKVIETSMIVFSTTERLNRASTIAAAYTGMLEQHRGELSEVQKEKLLMKAKDISDKAHGIYGKENLPSWARGSAAGSQIARSFYMYKTFTHNYLQLLVEMGFKKDVKSIAWMMLSPAVIAGCAANVLTPIITGLAQCIPGWEAPDDPEEAFYQWLEKNFGKTPERFARSGLAGMMGLNLKGSMSIDVLDFPSNIGEVLGAPYSLIKNIGIGIGNLAQGDLVKGAEKLSPRFMSGGFKAYREYTEGVTSRTNQPLYWGNERLKASFYDAFLRASGFNPAGISEKREIQWSERKIEREYTKKRSAIYARLRRFLLNGGSTATWIDIFADVESYNARVLRQGHKAVPLITTKVLRSLKTRMDKPLKRERLRDVDDLHRTSENFKGFSLMDLVKKNKRKRKRRRSLRRGLRKYVDAQ